MVKGLDVFIEHFRRYTGHYILIGGGAVDINMEQKGIPFRVTKDLDIILIVETLSDDLVKHFWRFIKDGEYAITQEGNKKTFYRFINPKTNGYPKMLKLFSRKPDLIKVADGLHLTDIPTGEEVSSLSAILMDDDYYNFTLKNATTTNDLHHATEVALIALKAKAFLNNRARKQAGQEVQEDDIIKHKKDIIRLTATLPPEIIIETPDAIRNDLTEYITVLQGENPDIKELLKNQHMGSVSLEQIISQLKKTFEIK